MKLTEKNARFAVVRTAFHSGGTISFHKSFEAASKARDRWIGESTCACGCAAVVPVTHEARREIAVKGGYYDDEHQLYADLPEWDACKGFRYDTICR